MSTNKVIEEINLCDPIPSIRQSKKRKSSDETIFIDLTIDNSADEMIVSSSKKSRLEENILISDEVTLSLSTLSEIETEPLISSSLSSGNGPRLTEKQLRIQKEQEEECVICYIPLAPVSTSENARLQFSVCTLSGASCSFCLACIKSFLSKTSGIRDSCPCCFNRIRSDTTLTILALPTNGREASLSTTELPQMLLPSTSSSSSSSSSSLSSSLHPTTSMSTGGYSGISEYQANLILSSGITPAQLLSMSESQRQSAATSVLKNEEEQKKRFSALEAFRSSLILGAGGPMMFAPRSESALVGTFGGRPLPTSATLPTFGISSGPGRGSSAVACPCSNCMGILPQPPTQALAPRPSLSEPPPTLRIKLATKKTGTRSAVSAAARAATVAITATTAAPSTATTTKLAAVSSALTASLPASAATASAWRASAPLAVAPPAVAPRRSKRKETK